MARLRLRQRAPVAATVGHECCWPYAPLFLAAAAAPAEAEEADDHAKMQKQWNYNAFADEEAAVASVM